ncbi:MAG: TolC family protein [Chitinophagaceae bacterium]|nr:TolC family protein [Oligoflexus sp.]
MTHIKNKSFGQLVSWSLAITLLAMSSGLQAQDNNQTTMQLQIVAPATAGALTLEQAMGMAYTHSYSRQSVEQDKLGSQARQQQYEGGLGPKVSVEAARGWIDKNVNKLAGQNLPTGQQFPDQIESVGVVVLQPLTAFISGIDRREAERKQEKSFDSQIITEANTAKLRGAEAYIQALKAVRFQAINRESQDLILKQKKDANSLRNAGKLSELDYSRFELAASEASSAVIGAEAQLRVASDNLREALGIAPGQALHLAELSEIKTETSASESRERSELTGASHRVEVIESQIKAQKVDYWPQVNAFLRASRDYALEDVNVAFGGLNFHLPKEDFRDQLSYGFNLQWDIWDWGTRSGRSAELGTNLSKARLAKDDIASRLRVETSQAEAEWDRATQTLKNAQVADKLSANILRSFDLRFRNGLATTTDLLSVQRDRTRAQANLANATYDLHGALLRKKRAEGVIL